MSKQAKTVSLHVNAGVKNSLGRAALALSGLSGAWVMMTNEIRTGKRPEGR